MTFLRRKGRSAIILLPTGIMGKEEFANFTSSFLRQPWVSTFIWQMEKKILGGFLCHWTEKNIQYVNSLLFYSLQVACFAHRLREKWWCCLRKESREERVRKGEKKKYRKCELQQEENVLGLKVLFPPYIQRWVRFPYSSTSRLLLLVASSKQIMSTLGPICSENWLVTHDSYSLKCAQ